MTVQRPLFDVDRTQPVACTVPGCGAIRTAGQHKVPTCHIDEERATQGWTRSRPTTCLNQIDPATAPFPDGF